MNGYRAAQFALDFSSPEDYAVKCIHCTSRGRCELHEGLCDYSSDDWHYGCDAYIKEHGFPLEEYEDAIP